MTVEDEVIALFHTNQRFAFEMLIPEMCVADPLSNGLKALDYIKAGTCDESSFQVGIAKKLKT